MANNRMVVWRGISRLDGVTPIVVLATGLGKQSQNSKTGGMVQTWILRDDIAPHVALRDGLDAAICGTCPHRSPKSGGSGACYVNVGQGPRSTWASHQANGSAPFDLDAFRGRKVRFGAYGDPAAVPFEVWQAIASVADGVTGYTHAWRTTDPRFAEFCMASCDSVDEYRQARRAGWRGFVVRPAGSEKPAGLVQCPASAEAGKRTVCASCMQCGGTGNGRTVSITIQAHGATRNRFATV
ncbi:hypothetical protein SEA_NANOSMITE_169 [Mycobacterium phage Nanosmite]|nr:hypothetical protein SEA_NANOSMITE_169 [Mycobacterium phage Nanosmite]